MEVSLSSDPSITQPQNRVRTAVLLQILILYDKATITQWETNMITLVALDKEDQVNFTSRGVSDLCVIACSTCSTGRRAAHRSLQPVAGEETSRQGLQERLIILVKKGRLSCRGWTPRRQERGIRTKVKSILDDTSQLSALRGAAKLKTPLRCFAECFRLSFVSQPLHSSMFHVQMATVLAHWEGIDRNAGLQWSAVTLLISYQHFLQTDTYYHHRCHFTFAFRHQTAFNRHILYAGCFTISIS